MIRLLQILVVICCGLLTACSTSNGRAEAVPDAAKPIPVTTALAQLRSVPASFDETGSFVADESSDVAPAVAGRVMATPVNIGDRVSAGQAICELDHADARLKLDQAKANLEQARFALNQAQSRVGWAGTGKFNPEAVPEVAAAKASYESSQSSAKLAAADGKRYENLVKSGDVSQSAWEKYRTQAETAAASANVAKRQYEAQLSSAQQNYLGVEGARAAVSASQAQVAQAEKSLADTTVRAPYDGFITDRPVAPGQYITSSNKVATLVRISSMKLRLQAPERRAAEVKPGMTVTASVVAYPGRTFTGRVSAVVPSVDSSTRSFTVEVRFENPKGELHPGMFASARVQLPGASQAVFVPVKSVVYDKTTDAYQLYTVSATNTAKLTVVLKGEADGDQVRILSGLSGNEKIALGGSDLYNGAPVAVRQ